MVVIMYNDKVLIPSLPRVPTSLIETMPDMIETNIRGSTIIFSRIKNKDEIVASRALMIKDSIKMLGKKKMFNTKPKTIPDSIESKTFFVKLIYYEIVFLMNSLLEFHHYRQ